MYAISERVLVPDVAMQAEWCLAYNRDTVRKKWRARNKWRSFPESKNVQLLKNTF